MFIIKKVIYLLCRFKFKKCRNIDENIDLDLKH